MSLFGSVSPKPVFTRLQTPRTRPHDGRAGKPNREGSHHASARGQKPVGAGTAEGQSGRGWGQYGHSDTSRGTSWAEKETEAPGCYLPPTWMPCKCCPWAELSRKPQLRPLGQVATLEELQNGDKWLWEPGPGRAQQPRSRKAQGGSTLQCPVPQRAAALRSMSPGLGEEESAGDLRGMC